MRSFTMETTVSMSYDETVARVRELLAEAGFGVLTEIDLANTLSAKLGVEMEPHLILGACRPQLAHRAVQADVRISTMLPCNVVVAVDGDRTRVEVFDPAIMTEFSGDSALAEVATDARSRLGGMLEALNNETEKSDAVES